MRASASYGEKRQVSRQRREAAKPRSEVGGAWRSAPSASASASGGSAVVIRLRCEAVRPVTEYRDGEAAGHDAVEPPVPEGAPVDVRLRERELLAVIV